MDLKSEYRTQFVIATLQCALVIGGSLLIGAMMKSMTVNFGPRPSVTVEILQFIRYFGLTFLLIPAGWTVATLLAERSTLWWATARTTFATGLVVLAALAIFYFWAVWAVIYLPFQPSGSL